MKKKPKNHARAEGKTHVSISMRQETLDAAKRLAEAEDRPFSNWVERLIRERVEDEKTIANSKNSGTVGDPDPEEAKTVLRRHATQ